MKKVHRFFALATMFLVTNAYAQFDIRFFVDKTNQANIVQANNVTNAAAWGNFNGDLFLDLFVVNNLAPNELYINNGGTDFTESAINWGINLTSTSKGVCVGDFNNDGFDDVYLLMDNNFNRLYINSNGSNFIDVTSSSGINYIGASRSAVTADFNKDGLLDIYLVVFDGQNKLYINNGNNTFSNETNLSGLGDIGGGVSASVGDVNNDGWMDIFLCNATSATNNAGKLFENNGNGTFTDITVVSGLAASSVENVFGASFFDYDSDGDLDLYLSRQSFNIFYQNNFPTFTEITGTTATGNSGISKGGNVLDYDSNGFPDILVGNEGGWSRIYKNPAILSAFPDKTLDLFDGVPPIYNVLGTAIADYNNDGKLDLFIANDGQNKLYQNKCNANQGADDPLIEFCFDDHWLEVVTKGGISNKNGIGAKITAYTTIGTTVVENVFTEVSSNGPSASKNTSRAFLGLGPSTIVDSLIVKWPLGKKTVLFGVPADQVLVVEEGGKDVGVIQILSPLEPPDSSYYAGSYVQLQCLVKNFSQTPETFAVFCLIDSSGTITYNGLQIVNSLLSQGTQQVTFTPPWHPISPCDSGTYSITFTTYLNGDINPNNDSMTSEPAIIGFSGFTNVTGEAFIAGQPSWDTQGACWGDIDNDGDEDLYIVNSNAANALFQNNGDGTFSNNTAYYGIGDGGNGWGAAFLDFDNDGWLDIYVANSGNNVLYHNLLGQTPPPIGPKFVNITTQANANSSSSSRAITCNDFDNDGFVDIYIANEVADNVLLHNNGDSTFTNIANSSNTFQRPYGHACSSSDFNNDSFTDMYIGHDAGQQNVLYFNNGNNTFQDIAASYGCNNSESWDISFFDYNNDGWMDIYATSTNYVGAAFANILYKNNFGNFYQNVTIQANLTGGVSQSWEAAPADYDNDAWQDIFVVDQASPAVLFYNNARDNITNNVPITFTEIGSLIGIATNISTGKSVTWADYDKDGDLDAYIGSSSANTLYRNDLCLGGRNFIRFKLTGVESNAAALGTRLKLYTPSGMQIRDIDPGSGRSQSSLIAHFGLYHENFIDSLVIEWHSGIHQVINGNLLNIGEVNYITESDCIPDVIVNPIALDYGFVPVGEIDSLILTIYNNNLECFLSISDIAAPFPWNAIWFPDQSKLPMAIWPDGQDSIKIYYNSLFSTAISSELKIKSNAPDILVPLFANGAGAVVDDKKLPLNYSLSQNYPNPFNPETKIEFSLPKAGSVKITVFDVLGREVKTLLSQKEVKAGGHFVVWNGKNTQNEQVASGVYFYRLEAGDFTETKKMVLLK
ncbi:VCBS repeat-containing protein [bacterium]|nr:VCBS repeat-containing protein [bacterium]